MYMAKQRAETTLALLDEFAPEKWLRPEEVASLFRVDPKTVTRWAKKGMLRFTATNGRTLPVRTFRTPGKHTRYSAEDIQKIIESPEAQNLIDDDTD
jgi:excisionase family DNA binding protein